MLALTASACASGGDDPGGDEPAATTTTVAPATPTEAATSEAEMPPPPPASPQPVTQAPAPVIVDCQTGLGPIVTYWSDGSVTGYSDYCQSVHDEVLRHEREANTFECDGVVCRNPYTGVEMPDPNATQTCSGLQRRSVLGRGADAVCVRAGLCRPGGLRKPRLSLRGMRRQGRLRVGNGLV